MCFINMQQSFYFSINPSLSMSSTSSDCTAGLAATGPSFFFFYLLLGFFVICNSSSSVTSSNDFQPQTTPPINTAAPDTIGTLPDTNPPVTTNPVSPPNVTTNPLNPPTVTDPINPPAVTNPVTPPDVTNPVTPPAVTNPVSPPVTNPVSPPAVTNPVSPPVTNPVSPPVTDPVNPPAVTNPVSPPVTDPVNPPAVTNPVNSPVTTNPVNQPVPAVGTPPTATSGSWCIAKNGASEAALQSGLDYACGIGGADCGSIQQGSSCYEPPTLENHASFAFNSYYQKNPSPKSCDFGGAAVLVTTNPSTGTCMYPSSSPTSTQTPVNPTSSPVNPTSFPTAPPTSSSGPTFPGAQFPPPAPGSSLRNPADSRGLGAFGTASPPFTNTACNTLQPFVISYLVVTVIMCWSVMLKIY